MKRFLLVLAMGSGIVGAATAQDIQTSPEASAVKQEIEHAGYRDVRGLAEDADGVWHGRALRGNTEVQLLVGQDGNVSLNR